MAAAAETARDRGQLNSAARAQLAKLAAAGPFAAPAALAAEPEVALGAR